MSAGSSALDPLGLVDDHRRRARDAPRSAARARPLSSSACRPARRSSTGEIVQDLGHRAIGGVRRRRIGRCGSVGAIVVLLTCRARPARTSRRTSRRRSSWSRPGRSPPAVSSPEISIASAAANGRGMRSARSGARAAPTTRPPRPRTGRRRDARPCRRGRASSSSATRRRPSGRRRARRRRRAASAVASAEGSVVRNARRAGERVGEPLGEGEGAGGAGVAERQWAIEVGLGEPGDVAGDDVAVGGGQHAEGDVQPDGESCAPHGGFRPACRARRRDRGR